MKLGFKGKFFFAGLLSVIVAIALYMKGYSDGSLKTANEFANTSNEHKQDIDKSQTLKKDSHLISNQNSIDALTPNGLHEVDSSVLSEDGNSEFLDDFESDDIAREMANVEEVDTLPRIQHEEISEPAE